MSVQCNLEFVTSFLRKALSAAQHNVVLSSPSLEIRDKVLESSKFASIAKAPCKDEHPVSKCSFNYKNNTDELEYLH